MSILSTLGQKIKVAAVKVLGTPVLGDILRDKAQSEVDQQIGKLDQTVFEILASAVDARRKAQGIPVATGAAPAGTITLVNTVGTIAGEAAKKAIEAATEEIEKKTGLR